ncbi:MAG: non-heme iron oxygenase ferredoxin subunit [Sphingomonadaceae bacterium]|nr:non-heme iron oxygenase ferredoxin subunit [Sphingomonadaceae bacterium]
MSDKRFVAVATLQEVPAGEKKCVDVDGKKILLCNSRDKIFAVENQCSHVMEPLEDGRMRGGWIACPVHGARFDLETGKALNPPALIPILTYEVRIDGQVIEIAV